MRRFSPWFTLVTLCLVACGKGNFVPATSAALAPPVTGYSLYHSYGDSITAGAGVSSASQIYVSLAAAYNSLPLTDYAYSADESCDVPTRQIFPNNDLPSLATPGLYTLLIGTNDADWRGTGAGESTFNLCDQAALSWLATPAETKLLGTAATVTAQGASHLYTQNNFNALATDAPGASITFPFTRPVAAPVYLWYVLTDTNPYTFTCTLDNGTPVTLSNAPTPLIQTNNGSAISLGVYRFAPIPAGTHALRCTQNGPGSVGMALVGIGWPPAAGTAHRPRVLTGLLTPQLNGQRAATLAAYDTDIRGNVALFAADGLDIELFNAAANMTGTTTDMFDDLHPNPLGHQEIFTALQRALN